MLPLFAHVGSMQIRAATGYQPHRVAAGVRINTKKGFRHVAAAIFEEL
jgi:hypothetical protein